jgi:uncharacterized phage protein (TIGR01671 family)
MEMIEFRMWDKVANKYFDLVNTVECLKQQLLGTFDHTANGSIFEQFSGELDKNGKKIFVGDILELPCHIKDLKRLLVVEWIDGIFAIEKNSTTECFLDRDTLRICTEIMEVVGNIHENKELIRD